MIWRRHPPHRTGWYWTERAKNLDPKDDGPPEPEIVFVDMGEGGTDVYTTHFDVGQLEDFVWWAGPIAKPEMSRPPPRN